MLNTNLSPIRLTLIRPSLDNSNSHLIEPGWSHAQIQKFLKLCKTFDWCPKISLFLNSIVLLNFRDILFWILKLLRKNSDCYSPPMWSKILSLRISDGQNLWQNSLASSIIMNVQFDLSWKRSKKMVQMNGSSLYDRTVSMI